MPSISPSFFTLKRVIFGLYLAAAISLPLRAAEPPKLAVVISIDQFRADYLDRFRPYFVAGGFNRLLTDGSVYTECHHRHATTTTANGHATLLTGVHADIHGIIGNEWLEPETLQKVGAVGDPDYPLVGAEASVVRAPLDVVEGKVGASPRRLLATTVGDQVKIRRGSAARVISISIKDRAAILMGGSLADGAYWLNRGRFVTSRFYRDTLPDWVESFDRDARIDHDFGREWTRLLDEKAYVAAQGPDRPIGKDNAYGLGTSFPRKVDGGKPTVSDSYYEAYRIAPFINAVLGDFAQAAVVGEQLGRHENTDLLCVSFSQPDYSGHTYGPDSHEQMDSILRLDRVIADFLSFLDHEIGTGRYVVVLSADHGVCPLPELIQGLGRGILTGRFDAAGVNRAVESALNTAFGPLPENKLWTVRDASGYRFWPMSLKAKNVTAAQAAAVVKAALLAQPQIAYAYTHDEILAGPAEGDTPLAAVRRSYHAVRSQDVMFVLQPYIVDRSKGGANHGKPYDFDNHVPLVWFGAGIVPGVHNERVGTDQLAPTLSAILGVPRPPQAAAERLF